MPKRIAHICILLLAVLLLTPGCDRQHAYGKIKIRQLPDKLEYRVGASDALDLSGMEIDLYLLDGSFKETMRIEDCVCTAHDPALDEERVLDAAGRPILNQIFIDASRVDFTRPGRYDVYLYYLGHPKPDARFKVRIVK